MIGIEVQAGKMFIKTLKMAIQMRRKQRSDKSSEVDNLLLMEAVLGGQMFGPTSDDTKRLFFVKDNRTVIWQENEVTTEYKLEPSKILKRQSGHSLEELSLNEARRLLTALRWHRHTVKKHLYQTA